MAATTLAVVTASRNGGSVVTPVAPDTSNGNIFPNNGAATLVVIDATGSATDVIFTALTQGTEDGLAVASNGPHTVTAGTIRVFGFYPDSPYNYASSHANAGKMEFTATGGDGGERVYAIQPSAS